MKEIMEFSSLLTKLQAWDTVLLRLVATWVIPYQPDRRIADQLGDLIRRAPRLEYVPVGEGFARGVMPWADEDRDGEGRGKAAVEVAAENEGARKGRLLRSSGVLAALLGFGWVVAGRLDFLPIWKSGLLLNALYAGRV